MKLFSIFFLFALVKASPILDGVENDPMINEGMFEGDIAGIDQNGRNIISEPSKMWPKGIIYYDIDSQLDEYRDNITKAMRVYEQQTNGCLEFIDSNGHGNYIHITVHGGCYSYIGMVGGAQTLSLGRGCHTPGVYLHELGHALGFYHEHSRSDRDDHVRIFWENIPEGKFDQFDKLKPFQNSLVVPYDTNSIMQYGSYIFSKNGQPTILMKNGSKIGDPHDKTQIDESDVKELLFRYKCKGGENLKEEKNYANLNCDFQHNTCDFKLYENNCGNLRRLEENGNKYLLLENGNCDEMRLKAPLMGYYKPKVCISIRYRISGGRMDNNYIELYARSNGQRKDVDLETKPTNGWVDFKKTVEVPKGVLSIDWVANVMDRNMKISIDEFNYNYGEC